MCKGNIYFPNLQTLDYKKRFFAFILDYIYFGVSLQ